MVNIFYRRVKIWIRFMNIFCSNRANIENEDLFPRKNNIPRPLCTSLHTTPLRPPRQSHRDKGEFARKRVLTAGSRTDAYRKAACHLRDKGEFARKRVLTAGSRTDAYRKAACHLRGKGEFARERPPER